MLFHHLDGCLQRKMKKSKLLFKTSEWDFSSLSKTMDVLNKLSKELKLNIYQNQIEIVNSEQMLDAYASVGLPIMYKHWSFGKSLSREYDSYKKGKSGLAYELVLNTNPCINYLMEENSATTQTLVLAHAAYGHNHFFKNNYLFKNWTDASSIVDYLIFAKNYIISCEEKYGVQAVEKILDSAHALQPHGIDRYRRPYKLSIAEEKDKQAEREEYLQSQVNELWDRTIKKKQKKKVTAEVFPLQSEENILYFLEKNSPILYPWQREVIRIVRKIAQYFYPQGQTKVMNEGWASFTHYYLMNRLWDEGYINDGAMLEFFALHTNVLFQPDFDTKYYNGLNPYYLGFEIFSDIKRMCLFPDDEDKELFPEIVGQPWVDTLLQAVVDYRDESFIRQFLSPKVIKKMRLFNLFDTTESNQYVVTDIHNRERFYRLRNALADKYLVDEYVPKLEVISADIKNDRKLTLQYLHKNNRTLSKDSVKMLSHVQRLWGYSVNLVDMNNVILYENLSSVLDVTLD